jgi:hypothetical protein
LVLVAILAISASVMAIWGRHRLRAQWEAEQQAQWYCEIATALRHEYDQEFKIWSSLEEDALLRRLWERELEVVRWPELELWVGVLDDLHPRVNFAPALSPQTPSSSVQELAKSPITKSEADRRPTQVSSNTSSVQSAVQPSAENANQPGPTPWSPLPIADFGRRLRLWSQNLATSFPCPTWGVPLWLSRFKARWSVDRSPSRAAERSLPVISTLQAPNFNSLKAQRELLSLSYRDDVEAFCRVDHSVARAKDRIRLIQLRCATREPADQSGAKRPDRCRLAQSKALATHREVESQRMESERKFLEKWQVWRLKAPPDCPS